ncbi:MAG: FtsK/SpoIIIE domain-containing protein [Candidatus Nanopelagicales bacterium]|nr:FtsK/SpoIIIE domain-containing protein [Candidatus Nanopelagicales bacterium]
MGIFKGAFNLAAGGYTAAKAGKAIANMHQAEMQNPGIHADQFGDSAFYKAIYGRSDEAQLRAAIYEALTVQRLTTQENPVAIRAITPKSWGKSVEIDLMRTGKTIMDYDERRDALAGALGAHNATFGPGSRPGRIIMHLQHQDPLTQDRGQWPVLDHGYWRIFWPIPFGVCEDGSTAEVDLWQSSILLGGLPGSGKSVAASELIAAAALDPSVDLRLCDPKRVELGLFRDRADAFATEFEQTVEILNRTLADIERRYRWLEEYKLRKIEPHHAPVFPAIVLVLDELAEITALGTKESKAAAEKLRRIVALGRAASVTVISGTQKPSADVVPTNLRDLFGTRWGGFCGSFGQAEVIVGSDVAMELTRIPANQPGTGLLLAETGQYQKCRSWYLSDADIAAIVAMATPARKRWLAENSSPWNQVEDSTHNNNE